MKQNKYDDNDFFKSYGEIPGFCLRLLLKL